MGRPLRSCGRRGRRCGAGGAASRAPGTVARRGAAGKGRSGEPATCGGWRSEGTEGWEAAARGAVAGGEV